MFSTSARRQLSFFNTAARALIVSLVLVTLPLRPDEPPLRVDAAIHEVAVAASALVSPVMAGLDEIANAASRTTVARWPGHVLVNLRVSLARSLTAASSGAGPGRPPKSRTTRPAVVALLASAAAVVLTEAPAGAGQSSLATTTVNINPGAVTTFAGDGTDATVDGTGSAARFRYMGNSVVVGGYAYVGTAGAIRRVDLSSGAVTIFAGNSAGATTCLDDSDPTVARFGQIADITTDGTYLYVTGCAGSLVRKVDLSSGAVTTIPSVGGATNVTFGPDGFLYVAEFDAFTSTVSLNKVDPATGSSSTVATRGVVSGLNPVSGGIAADGTYVWWNLSVGGATRLDRITVVGGSSTTVIADGLKLGPLASAGNYLYQARSGASVGGPLRRITKSSGAVADIAGVSSGGLADGTGTDAWLSNITGIATDGTNLIVSDNDNRRLRQVAPGTALPSAQSSLVSATVAISPGQVTTVAGSGTNATVDGTGFGASFSGLGNSVVVGGFAYIATVDSIRKMDLSSGAVTTLAGRAGVSGCQDSPDPAQVTFGGLTDLTTDGHYLFASSGVVTNCGIRRISLATGATSTIAFSGVNPTYLAMGPDGNLYAASKYADITLYRVNPTTGAATVVKTYTSADGADPETGGIAADATSIWWNVKVGSAFRIDKVVVSTGAVSTVVATGAGRGPLASAGDDLYGSWSAGSGSQNEVRRYAKSDASSVAIAGKDNTASYADGTGADAWFNSVTGIATDGTNLYASDDGNHRIRKIVVGTVGPVGGPLTPGEDHKPNPAIPGCPCARAREGDPVDTYTGAFSTSFDDLFVPGRGVPLHMTHAYSSSDVSTDVGLGYGWSFPAAMRMTFNDPATGQITVHQENGATATFTLSGGVYVAAPRVIATLVHHLNDTWTFTRHQTDITDFDSSGQLAAQRTLNGYSTTITRPSSSSLVVTEPGGRSMTFTLSGGHVSGATSPSGRSIGFVVDGAGDLVDFVDVNGGHHPATYDSNHLLLTIQEPKYVGSTATPAPLTTNHYDSSSRVDSQTDALGRITTLDYTTVPGSTIITDAKGDKQLDEYRDGVLRSQTFGYGTADAIIKQYGLDMATLARTRETDGNGNSWVSTVDSQGNTTSTVNPVGDTTFASYNSLNEPLVTKDGMGVPTTRTWDSAGNPLTISKPLLDATGAVIATSTTTFHYDGAPGDITSVTGPDGQTWPFTYDTYGNRTNASDPLGDKASATFDLDGFQATSTSPRGNLAGANPADFTTTFVRDPDGLVASTTDPQGHVNQNHHDANRNTDYSIDPDGNRTDQDFDAANELTTVHRPDGTTLVTDYYLDGLPHHTYDGANQPRTYDFTAAKLPKTSADPLGRTKSFGHDAAGNPTTVTEGGLVTTTSYDAANRPSGISYSDGMTPNVSGITYDHDGRRTDMTDGTGASSMPWDSLGRMTSSTSGGKTTGYTHDLIGNVTSIVYPDNQGTVAHHFDNANREDSLTDWLGQTFTFSRDADGNITGQGDPNGTASTNVFDHADRLMSMAYALSGGSPFASFSYGRDNSNQVTSVTSTGVPADNHGYTYNQLNQLKGVDATTHAYDAADNLTGLPDGTKQSFDAANQITASAATITQVATGSAADAASATLTATFSTTAAVGDQILVAVTLPDANTVSTAPSGYTLVGNVTSGTNGTREYLYRKTAAGGEASAAVGFSAGGLYGKSVLVGVYRGVNPSTPLDVTFTSGTTTSGNTVTAPSQTTVNGGARLVLAEGEIGNLTTGTWAHPTGMTGVVSRSDVLRVSSALGDQALGAPGATGTRVATFSQTARPLAGIMVALRPAITTYGFDSRGNRTSVTPPGGSATTLGYDQANRLKSFGTSATYAYRGDGLRMSKTVSGVTTPFSWDESGGLPLMITEGTRAYVYGPDGLVVEHIDPRPTITSVATGSAASATAATLTATLSTAAAAGDQIIVTATLPDADAVSTAPSGYTQVSNVTSGTLGTREYVWRKTAAGGETSVAATFDNAGLYAKALVAVVYRGVDPTTPLDVAATSGTTASGTTVTAPSLTTVTAGARLVMAEGETGNLATGNWTQPTGMTDVVHRSDVLRVVAAIGDQGLGAAGATGTRQASYPTGQALVGVLLALRPAPVPVVFYHHDQIGSTRLLTDRTGGVVATQTFDSYGRQVGKTGSVTTPFGFVGEYADAESGLVYLRARYYDPTTGQFLSRDPLVAVTGNAYGYAGGDPLSGIDPSGLRPSWGDVGHFLKGNAANILVVVAVTGATICVLSVACGVAVAGAAGTIGMLGTGALLAAGVAGDGVVAEECIAGDLAAAEQHLGSIDALTGPNRAMLDRIANALSDGRSLTTAEQNFLQHEVTEARLVSRGLSLDAAHDLAMNTHETFANYDPEVIKAFPEYFNDAWRRYWGI